MIAISGFKVSQSGYWRNRIPEGQPLVLLARLITICDSPLLESRTCIKGQEERLTFSAARAEGST